MAALFTKRKQLQWLALLAIAVLLPTVSLLWFMSRVIANERLVVQEKLRVLYQDKLADAIAQTDAHFRSKLAALDRIAPAANPYPLFRQLVLEDKYQGVVLWDSAGNIAYPRAADSLGNSIPPDNPLAAAWQAEFANRDFVTAADLYERFTSQGNPGVAIAAMTGRARCLARLGQLEEAVAECERAAFHTGSKRDAPALGSAIDNARLQLLSLLKQSSQTPAHEALFQRTVTALMADLYSSNPDPSALPANQNLFIAQKVLEALKGPYRFPAATAQAQLEQLVAAESLSIAAAESFRPFAGQFDAVFRTRSGEISAYALRRQNPSATVLVLLSPDAIAAALSGFNDEFTGTEAAYRILDGFGNFVAGLEEPRQPPFNVSALPPGFPGWKVELYFQGGDVFERAADRQIAVYTWTGFLVILLIVIVGGLATRAIGRQIRLNEMKNDFIATVSHELKTPLASMRVLVDTLLEGNVNDEAKTQEYLRLTAKENERLSRMIDNFLTFSRMERNKVALTLVDANPSEMASDTVESVKTKFAAHHCHLSLDLAPDLPVIQADHDAMVTVLVNLLDNACKYTTEDKRVTLRIYSEPAWVCFAVTDNGIGLARRHWRRIFDRFYQVDNSLARKAEGCGLGLSIVKFIVDAHHGTISVESKPGQGSTFTVRLPLGPREGD